MQKPKKDCTGVWVWKHHLPCVSRDRAEKASKQTRLLVTKKTFKYTPYCLWQCRIYMQPWGKSIAVSTVLAEGVPGAGCKSIPSQQTQFNHRLFCHCTDEQKRSKPSVSQWEMTPKSLTRVYKVSPFLIPDYISITTFLVETLKGESKQMLSLNKSWHSMCNRETSR